jgi:phytoene dehydrogenase-like protein
MHYIANGCFYPRGGSFSIVHGLVQTILANGGSVLCRARVQEIVVENNRACGEKIKNFN